MPEESIEASFLEELEYYCTVSRSSDNIVEILRAERYIAGFSVLHHSVLFSGSVGKESSDPYVHLWRGLMLMKEAPFTAAPYFFQALKHLHHWRVLLYLKILLENTGNLSEAAIMESAVLAVAPNLDALLRQVEESDEHSLLYQDPIVHFPPTGRPLVSAVVSTYNSERFMRGCLQNLVEQTLYAQGLLEIIVVDSGSKQRESDIVHEFQRRYQHIFLVRTEETETVYGAWNRGIRAATGKYITNANTDDRHRPDTLAYLADILERRKDIAVVYGDAAITGTENETFENAHIIGHFRWPEFDPAELLHLCYVGPQPLWRCSLHEQYGYFDSDFRSAGDYEFWLRIASREQFLHLQEVFGLYLQSPASIEYRNKELSDKEAEIARNRYRHTLPDSPLTVERTMIRLPVSLHSIAGKWPDEIWQLPALSPTKFHEYLLDGVLARALRTAHGGEIKAALQTLYTALGQSEGLHRRIIARVYKAIAQIYRQQNKPLRAAVASALALVVRLTDMRNACFFLSTQLFH